MLALGLAIAGTASAQNAPQSKNQNNQENRYGKERGEKKPKGKFHRSAGSGIKSTPEQIATRRTEKLSQQLDLSSKQKRQLQALHLNQARQRESLRGQSKQPGARNENQRAEMQRQHASYEKELKDILNKKQYAKYQEERKQMQARRENRSDRNGEDNDRFRRPNNG